MTGSYFTLTALTEPMQQDLADTFRRMAERLEGTEDQGYLRVRIAEGDDPDQGRGWTLKLGNSEATVTKSKRKSVDFEIITDKDTWWEIAQGSLAPLRAFTEGRMRVRGDVEFGTRALKHLASQSPPKGKEA